MMPHLCVILSWDPTKRMRAAQTVYCCSATDPDTPQQRDESFCKIPFLISFAAMEIFCQAGKNERWKGPCGTFNALRCWWQLQQQWKYEANAADLSYCITCISILNGFLDYNALLAQHTVTFVLVSFLEKSRTFSNKSLSLSLSPHLEEDYDLTV